MKRATDAQKWRIANTVKRMAANANERSAHGKAFRDVAAGFSFYSIRADLTMQEASRIIGLLEDAQGMFGGNPEDVMAAAEAIKAIKA